MKVVLEVKEEGKVTKYSADVTKMGEPAKRVVDSVVSFLERTFGSVFTKETRQEGE